MIYASPIWKVGQHEVSFIGELDKWTAVSPQRFYNIDIMLNSLLVFIKGVSDELVSMKFTIQYQDDKMQFMDWDCKLPPSGRSILTVEFQEKTKTPVFTCQN